MVETSPTSHVVTIPTFSFHHHHHAQLPPPPSSTPATAHVWANPGRGRRRHVTPTTNPTTHLDPATTPKLRPSSMPRHPDDNPDDAPDDAPQYRHITRQLRPSTMPRHPDDVANDATSRHRPSSTTTATSLPNGNSRRWGRWGRTDGGENARGGGKERRRASCRRPPDLLSTPGGMEGGGQRRGTSLSPGVLDDDTGAHMCPFVPTRGIVDGGRCESHMPPPV